VLCSRLGARWSNIDMMKSPKAGGEGYREQGFFYMIGAILD